MCPPTLQASCGWLQPSAGHARRMCRILRSELCRQVRVFKDCLRVSCHASERDGRRCSTSSYQEWCRTSNEYGEFLCNIVRPTLPTKTKSATTEGKLLNLSASPLPESVQSKLRLGPKFGFEPSLNPVEKVVMARTVSGRVEDDLRPRCVVECVNALTRTDGRKMNVSCLSAGQVSS